MFHHPAVLEVAVFGIPHEKFGDMVHAEVVAKPGTTVTIDDIGATCASVSAAIRYRDRSWWERAAAKIGGRQDPEAQPS